MSIFEIIALSLSLILGLGIAQLLSNTVNVFRNRKLWVKHLTTFVWVFIIFILQIQFLFSVHGLDNTQEKWSTFHFW